MSEMLIRLLAFWSPKGGSGKTTLATQSVCVAKHNGLNVCFYDLDPQLSASNYFKLLAQSEPQHCPDTILTSLNSPPPQGTQVIICDYPPNVEQLPPEEFTIVAPTLCNLLDIHSYQKVIELASKEHNRKLIKVINQLDYRKSACKQVAEHFKFWCPVSSNTIISNAMNQGKSILTMPNTDRKKVAVNQFTYLLACTKAGYVDRMDLPPLFNDISIGVKKKPSPLNIIESLHGKYNSWE